ncbi:MAG TPA: RtcB family protein [Tepidisphaeraceae bacterium]|nr:RtcB family protein [Tepidisphaeraceae bacterium]
MTYKLPDKVKAWLAQPMPADVRRAVERIARASDVRHVAIMPDVHLARDVCVGTVVATTDLIYPAAVGSDIGCGIAAIAFDADATLIGEGEVERLFDGLAAAVPIHRHRSATLPRELAEQPLSDRKLESIRRHDGAVQFGTLGRGNHFLEFQADDDGRLWLMVHSGSRAIGQAIRDFHESAIATRAGQMRYIEADSARGAAYLTDAAWARAYARASRRAMIDAAAEVLRKCAGAHVDPASYFDCDHNHVRREAHFGVELWVHRKGAMSADADEPGMVPGSMGTESFHVRGRGNPESLRSTSHGAGRAMSREQARRCVRVDQVQRSMRNVHYQIADPNAFREESPAAYKDIRAVLRAEAELTRIVRRLRPLLSYKGG